MNDYDIEQEEAEDYIGLGIADVNLPSEEEPEQEEKDYQ